MLNDRILEMVFSITTLAATAGWLALIFAYKWAPLKRILTWVVIPIMLTVIYLGLLLTQHGTQGGLTSLSNMSTFVQSKHALLAIWVHGLAFDLLVGTSATYDAEANRVPHLLIVPALLLMLFFGPLGLCLYLLVRFFYQREAPLAR
jgi:ABA DEFICIENT 4-like